MKETGECCINVNLDNLKHCYKVFISIGQLYLDLTVDFSCLSEQNFVREDLEKLFLDKVTFLSIPYFT